MMNTLVGIKTVTDKNDKLYRWDGDIYRIDLTAPPGERVLIKEGNKFVAKPGIGTFGATIEFEGVPV